MDIHEIRSRATPLEKHKIDVALELDKFMEQEARRRLAETERFKRMDKLLFESYCVLDKQKKHKKLSDKIKGELQ